MIRFSFIFIFILSVLGSKAQNIHPGAYVATDVRYLSGNELPDEDIQKYLYRKYTFSKPDKFEMSSDYDQNGQQLLFSVSGNRLLIKNEKGFVTNMLRIVESTTDKLVLAEISTNDGLYDPWALKYTFENEQILQKNMPLSPDDVFSVDGVDTIYKSSPKIYAQFKEPSFRAYIRNRITSKVNVDSGELISTFIINTDGRPDSLKIVQGINPAVDAAYIKAFNSTRKLWKPAQHNGKNVKVLMTYSLSPRSMPAIFASDKAIAAYMKKDYIRALFHFDKALLTKGDEVTDLYRRGICKLKTGDLKGACEDWTRIKQLGHTMGDKVLLKYCK